MPRKIAAKDVCSQAVSKLNRRVKFICIWQQFQGFRHQRAAAGAAAAVSAASFRKHRFSRQCFQWGSDFSLVSGEMTRERNANNTRGEIYFSPISHQHAASS